MAEAIYSGLIVYSEAKIMINCQSVGMTPRGILYLTKIITEKFL